jgi:DNA repair exonuclease SbcCD nuclease subunit
MRILASADHHIDTRSKRWATCQQAHEWIVEVVRSEGIDLFLSGGDVYDGPSSPIDREYTADVFVRIGERCPVVIAKGNHDERRDCELLSKLGTRHPIRVEERAGVVRVGGVAVGVMAWPERGGIVASQMHLDGKATGEDLTQAQLERQFGRDHVENATRDALQAVLRGLGADLQQHRNEPRILLGHLMVDGAMTSAGQPLVGSPMNVALSELALAGAQLGILGHIHMAQSFDVSGAPHHYTGSPFRTDYGQLEPKGALVAEFNDVTGQFAGVRFIESPCPRMDHIELWWGGPGEFYTGAACECEYRTCAADLGNTELRLRYHVPVDMREAAARRAAEIADFMRANGAMSVKIEPITIATHRARAPEVAQAHGIADKLTEYWKSIGFDPGARRGSLLAKATELEEQVRRESHASA